ncbi:hypothetical protein OSK51_28375, partial [Escherichia coli]|nr:hypothetical protein [Escherichia coli]
ELDYYARKLRFQEKQLGGQRSYLRLAEREYELIDKDIKLAESMYTRDSILYVRKAMIAAEFEESGQIPHNIVRRSSIPVRQWQRTV